MSNAESDWVVKKQIKEAVNPDVIVFDRDLIRERDYWVERLSQPMSGQNIDLPPGFPSTQHSSNEVDQIDVRLRSGVYHTLLELTNGSGFLLYTVLLSALKVCLHKYTGSRTVVVGSPARMLEENKPQAANVLAIVDEV